MSMDRIRWADDRPLTMPIEGKKITILWADALELLGEIDALRKKVVDLENIKVKAKTEKVVRTPLS